VAEGSRGEGAWRVLPDEREASPEAHKHKAATAVAAEKMRRRPQRVVGRRMR
jgi:hypothetical protein